MYRKGHRIHFVGIAGSGMSGIAEVLANLGYRVSGSDLAENDVTKRLADRGATLRSGEVLVAEADESDGSFLHLAPTIAVLTNIDREHLDHHGSMVNLRNAFLRFVNKVPFYGLAVLNLDHPLVQGLLPDIEKRWV